MRFYKLLNEDGTLNRIGTGEDGEEISQEEYDSLLEEIRANAEHYELTEEELAELAALEEEE